MQNFIVLGLIPGTQIQINFGLWLVLAGGFIGIALLRIALRYRRTLSIIVLSFYMQRALHERQPHANPYHLA